MAAALERPIAPRDDHEMSTSTASERDFNSVDTVRVAMRGLETVGLQPEPELVRAGAVVVDGAVRGGLSRAAYCRLWARVSRAAGCDDFGLQFAERVETGIVGPLEWLATTARTVGHGLDALASCGRLLHTGGHYALERRGPEAAFVYYAGPTAPSRVLIDWSFGYLLRAIRRATSGAVAPSAVRVQYAAPRDTTRVEQAFGAPVQFAAPLNEIVFSREQLEAPLATFDAEVHATLEGLCRARCAAANERDLRARVRAMLLRQLAREALPSIEQVARGLGMSTRSLQRGLACEELSFRQLVLEARMETAQRWLADPTRTVSEVAYSLGYSEPSAFHRAYRGYFGRPCREAALVA